MQESVIMSQNGKGDMEHIRGGMGNIYSITVLSVQIVLSVEGMGRQTKNVAVNSATVAEEAEKLEMESKELMNHIGRFQV